MLPFAIADLVIITMIFIPLFLKLEGNIFTYGVIVLIVIFLIIFFRMMAFIQDFNNKYACFPEVLLYTDCVVIDVFVGPGTSGQVVSTKNRNGGLTVKLGRSDDGLRMNYRPAIPDKQMGFLDCLYIIDNPMEVTTRSYGIFMDLELYCILYAYLKNKNPMML